METRVEIPDWRANDKTFHSDRSNFDEYLNTLRDKFA